MNILYTTVLCAYIRIYICTHIDFVNFMLVKCHGIVNQGNLIKFLICLHTHASIN